MSFVCLWCMALWIFHLHIWEWQRILKLLPIDVIFGFYCISKLIYFFTGTYLVRNSFRAYLCVLMMQKHLTLVLCNDLKGEHTIYMAGVPNILYRMKELRTTYQNYGIWKCDCMGTIAFYFNFLERKHLTICNWKT